MLMAFARFAAIPVHPTMSIRYTHSFESRSMQPSRLSSRALSLASTLSLGLVLSACSISPGFNMSAPSSAATTSQGQALNETPPTTAPDGTPASVQTITPELLQARRKQAPTELPESVTALFGEALPYTIGESDVIGIIVYDHPELLPNAGSVISQQADPTGVSAAPGFIVDSSGEIFFPYIGRVKVLGLTQTEAAQLITQRLSAYIKDPQVTVRIQAFRSKRVYVEGQVRVPGMQIFTDVPMTLPEAINRAGGLTPLGDRSEILLTRNGSTTRIDLNQLDRLHVNASKILMRNGDNIRVISREEKRVYVMGEAVSPSSLLMNNGELSLGQALGESGGVNPTTGDPAQIYVIRSKEGIGQEIFHLNAKSPVALALADNFPLQARDVVYIDPVPLARWSRVFSLLPVIGSYTNGSGSQFTTR